MTALDETLAIHRLWKLKPAYAHLRVFDQFIENEFCAPAELRAWQAKALRQIVQFAVSQTPFYAALFSRLGIKASDVETPDDLIKLPALHKHDVLDSMEALTARNLPPGETPALKTSSSGTTGRKVSVVHSSGAVTLNYYLRHRIARWHGHDPRGTSLDVRAARDVLQGADGTGNPDGVLVRRVGWKNLGEFFYTGPQFAFNIGNAMDQQLEWLRKIRPHYVMSYPTLFEEWLLAAEGAKPVDSILGLGGLGAELTASLRAAIEKGYGVPIDQSYGLNEIGKVAVRCAHGRYHVNIEHCHVEIVDEAGMPCRAGEIGHVLVTGFRNFCMPLLRYDTGDLAAAVDGPCPCGRVLPSFGEIAGRYRRFAGLPAGTRERVRAVRETIEHMAPEHLTFLRRYQLFQDRENRFTLRLKTVAPVNERFRATLLAVWAPFDGASGSPLAIVSVDEIAPAPSGKLLDFLSEFFTDSASPLPPGTAAH